MGRLIDANKLKAYLQDKYVMYDHTLADIDAQPTVDAERHGHWILQTNGHGMCSTCGTFVDLLNGMTWEYCPHCGAKMDEVEE